MNPKLEELKKKVEENESVVDSAVELIDGLKGKLEEIVKSGEAAAASGASGAGGGGGSTQAIEDITADVQGLIDELDAQGDKLAAAVAKNTDSEDDSASGVGSDSGGESGGGASSEPSSGASSSGGESGQSTESEPHSDPASTDVSADTPPEAFEDPSMKK